MSLLSNKLYLKQHRHRDDDTLWGIKGLGAVVAVVFMGIGLYVFLLIGAAL